MTNNPTDALTCVCGHSKAHHAFFDEVDFCGGDNGECDCDKFTPQPSPAAPDAVRDGVEKYREDAEKKFKWYTYNEVTNIVESKLAEAVRERNSVQEFFAQITEGQLYFERGQIQIGRDGKWRSSQATMQIGNRTPKYCEPGYDLPFDCYEALKQSGGDGGSK